MAAVEIGALLPLIVPTVRNARDDVSPDEPLFLILRTSLVGTNLGEMKWDTAQ